MNRPEFMSNKFSRTILLVLITLIISVQGYAQDPQYTQFYANQPMLNPSFTGAGSGPRASMNYRAQWVSIPGSYRQIAFGYDQPLYFGRSVQGAGILLHNDRAGEGNLNKLDILLNYSFAVQLGRTGKEHYLRFGLQGGVQQASIDFYRLRFSDQIDPELGFIRATNEQPIQSDFRPDVSAGLSWYNKFAWAGFSVHHITQPDQKWEGLTGNFGDTRLPMRFTGTAGVSIPAGPMGREENIVISPSVIFMKQRNFNQLNLGSYATIKPVVFGLWYRTTFNNFNGAFMQSDMIAGLVGFKEGVFSVGYSYDYTISRLTNGISGGSHELAIIVEFDYEKKKTMKHRSLPCPHF